MSAILSSVLAVLSSLLPVITASGGAATGSLSIIINALAQITQIMPIVVQEADDVVPLIQSLIAEISSNATVTQDQLTALATLSAQIDASFEAAAKADGV